MWIYLQNILDFKSFYICTGQLSEIDTSSAEEVHLVKQYINEVSCRRVKQRLRTLESAECLSYIFLFPFYLELKIYVLLTEKQCAASAIVNILSIPIEDRIYTDMIKIQPQ